MRLTAPDTTWTSSHRAYSITYVASEILRTPTPGVKREDNSIGSIVHE